jgi:hypothetical protein
MEGHALSCPIETSQTAVEAGVSPTRDLEFAPKAFGATTEIAYP